jgi:hypothetical protein
MGAYRNVISALNLNFHLSAKGDGGYEGNINRVGQLPVRISLTDYPQLKEFAWHVQGFDELTLIEVHSIYERNKCFLEIENLSDSEQALMELLGVAFEGAGS